MAAANKARGEVEFSFGGRRYTVAPSFETVARIEAAIGPTGLVLGLVQQHGIVATVKLLTVLLDGREGAPPAADIPAMAMRENLIVLQPLLVEFLLECIRGDEPPDPGGNGKAGAT